MRHLLPFIILLTLISCSNVVTEQDILRDISADIRQNYNGGEIKVVSLDMEHLNGKDYLGILETLEDGETYFYEIDILIDGGMFYWEIRENESSFEKLIDVINEFN